MAMAVARPAPPTGGTAPAAGGTASAGAGTALAASDAATGGTALGAGDAAVGWRLTRRGRVVLAALVALLVMAVVAAASIAAGGGIAQATSHGPSRYAAERDLARVTVRPGQSLWSVAEAADPGADTRVVIQQIIELNALTGMTLNPGEQLWVPRG